MCPAWLRAAFAAAHNVLPANRLDQFMEWVAAAEFLNELTPTNVFQAITTVIATATEDAALIQMMQPFNVARPERKDKLDFVNALIARTVGTPRLGAQFNNPDNPTTFVRRPNATAFASGLRALRAMVDGVLEDLYIKILSRKIY